MIAVNINAGLANQMFHYAFGRGLMTKGLDICFDQTNFKPRSQWSFEFVCLQDAFPNIEIKQMPAGHFKYVFPRDSNKFIAKFQGLMRKLHNVIGDEIYIMEPSFSYTDGMEKKAKRNCIYRGFWQSEKYFKHCKKDIQTNFLFKAFDEPENINLSNKMANENSVAIHVRKGADYLKFLELWDGTCPVEYYDCAIAYIKEQIENPVFYVFTDNPQWVKENIRDIEYTLVDWNPISGKKNFRDMQLMSCAKHNIIANSTYSWWGAWLNDNVQKIVIAPERWFKSGTFYGDTPDLVPEEWIRL